MKQVVEAYAGLWIIMLMLMLALAFTSINMNTAQARKIVADIKAEVQASNGEIVPISADGTGTVKFDSESYGIDGNPLPDNKKVTIAKNGYSFKYQIDRQSLVSEGINNTSETYIYNSIYKIKLEYKYSVPLFGTQIYPIEVFAY